MFVLNIACQITLPEGHAHVHCKQEEYNYGCVPVHMASFFSGKELILRECDWGF